MCIGIIQMDRFPTAPAAAKFTFRRFWSVWHYLYICHKDPELVPDWAVLHPIVIS